MLEDMRADIAVYHEMRSSRLPHHGTVTTGGGRANGHMLQPLTCFAPQKVFGGPHVIPARALDVRRNASPHTLEDTRHQTIQMNVRKSHTRSR